MPESIAFDFLRKRLQFLNILAHITGYRKPAKSVGNFSWISVPDGMVKVPNPSRHLPAFKIRKNCSYRFFVIAEPSAISRLPRDETGSFVLDIGNECVIRVCKCLNAIFEKLAGYLRHAYAGILKCLHGPFSFIKVTVDCSSRVAVLEERVERNIR